MTKQTNMADLVLLDAAPEDDVSERLDDVAVGVLEKVETILSLRETLNELFEAGLLDLARARYATSNKSVSALQLHFGEIRAQRTVISSAQKGESTGGTYTHFELVRDGSPQTKNAQDALRKRHGEVKADDEDDKKLDAHLDSDPLKWFGVLVPSSLRNSQRRFVSALEVIADIATAQSHLQDQMEWYEKHKPRQVQVPE